MTKPVRRRHPKPAATGTLESKTADEAPRFPRRHAVPLALLSAACIVFAFPPYDISPLVFVAYVPLLVVATRVPPKRAFLLGWLAGLAITAAGFYFIIDLTVDFGGMPVPVALLLHLMFSAYQGLGIGIFGALTSWLHRRGHALALVAPAAYVAAEVFCREIFIFPWYLSNATYTFLAFLQGADLVGGFGLTALIALVNAALYRLGEWLWMRRKGASPAFPRAAVGTAVVLLAANLVYGAVRIAQIDERAASVPTIRIGTVEANIGMFEKTDPDLILNNMLIQQRFSAELEARGADLIVWPETAANPPRYAVSRAETRDVDALERSLELLQRAPRNATWYRPSEAPLVADYRDDMRGNTPVPDRVGIQRGFRTPLLFGTLTVRQPTAEEAADKPPHPRRPSHIRYNTAVLVDADGHVLGSYDKNVLLVFGEWVPLSHWLWRTFGLNFYEMVPAAGDVTPGEEVAVLELPLEDDEGHVQEVRIGVMICYEDIIAEYGLRMAELGPNLFINIINDAWFGESSAAYHHMAFSVMRAVEHRIPLVRATNTGVSSVVDPVGRIVAQTSLRDAETMLEDVPIMPPPETVYAQIGDVVGWGAWAGVIVMIVWRRRGDGRSSR